MSASVVSAIVSTVTTVLLAYIVRQLRKFARGVSTYRKEHDWLMTNVQKNTEYTARIMTYLNMKD